jgi:hypothetical protein
MTDENMSDQPAAAPEPSAPDPVDALANRFESRLQQISGAVENLSRGFQQTRTVEAENRLRTQASQLDEAARRAEAGVLAAENALKEAFEQNDASAIARAQRIVSERVLERDKAKTRRTEFDRSIREAQRRAQEKRPETPPAQQPPSNLSDANLRQWKDKHKTWYGVDADLTKAALDIHDSIQRAGVIPVGSTQYFNTIDQQMAQKYPDRFNRSPDVSGGSSGSGTAAKQSPGGGRIPASVIDGWERMGINVRDPKTIERMVGHRQRLAEKGILPAEVVRERVRT